MNQENLNNEAQLAIDEDGGLNDAVEIIDLGFINIDPAFKYLDEAIGTTLQKFAEMRKFNILDLEVVKGTTLDDCKSINTLLKKGNPLLMSLILKRFRNKFENFKVIDEFPNFKKERLTDALFLELGLILTQARGYDIDSISIPLVFKNTYKINLNKLEVDALLYGNKRNEIGLNWFKELEKRMNFGPIGNRLNLGFAGARNIKAMRYIQFNEANSPTDAKAIGLLRLIGSYLPLLSFHPLLRSDELMKAFGNFNNVCMYLIKEYGTLDSVNQATQSKIIFGNLLYGTQGLQHLSWNYKVIHEVLCKEIPNFKISFVEMENLISEEIRLSKYSIFSKFKLYEQKLPTSLNTNINNNEKTVKEELLEAVKKADTKKWD